MKRLLMSSVTAFCALFASTEAPADVTWHFIATSVDKPCFECGPISILPATVGYLTVSDDTFLSGELSYSYLKGDDPFVPPQESGETNFSLFLGGTLNMPHVDRGSSEPHAHNVALTFSLDGIISGLITTATPHDWITMTVADGSVTRAKVDTDYIAAGCGFFTQCYVDGFWQLMTEIPSQGTVEASIVAPIPEAVDALFLASLYLLAGMFAAPRRRNTTYRQASGC